MIETNLLSGIEKIERKFCNVLKGSRGNFATCEEDRAQVVRPKLVNESRHE